MVDKFLIGDTIRFTGGIENLDGEPYSPPVITVSVFRKNGACLLDKEPAFKTGDGEYKYEWKIEGTEEVALIESSDLIVVWDWSGPHKKRMNFKVIPETE